MGARTPVVVLYSVAITSTSRNTKRLKEPSVPRKKSSVQCDFEKNLMNKKIKILLKIDGTRELKISLYMQLGEKVYYSLSSVNLLQVNRFLSLTKILQV